MPSRPPKALQKLWYDKLKAEGFKDLEYDENHVKQWAAGRARRTIRESSTAGKTTMIDTRAAYQQSKQDYYRLAGFFLHDHEFDNNTELLIWTLHAEGVTMRAIVKQITDLGMKHRDLTTVKEIIHKLRNLMLKRYGEAHEEE